MQKVPKTRLLEFEYGQDNAKLLNSLIIYALPL